jgi:hypothetical protein
MTTSARIQRKNSFNNFVNADDFDFPKESDSDEDCQVAEHNEKTKLQI